eukprot:Skav232557  [mRNA]  locus=scaffold3309:59634:60557:- [translate_table: standard]
MDEVIARVNGYRDVLLSGSESQISDALAGLSAIGNLSEKVLLETFVGLAADKISKDPGLPERLKQSSRELLRCWQDGLKINTASKRERSPRQVVDVAAVPGLTKQRERVLEKLTEALSSAASRCLHSASSASNFPKEPGLRSLEGLSPYPPTLPSLSRKPAILLAAEIEHVLHKQLEGRQYVNQARSLLYNIKDASNSEFCRSLLQGDFDVCQLPSISAEDMASSSRNARRAQVRKEALEAAAMRPADHMVTDKFVCEKCGSTNTAYTQSAAVESCVRSGGEPVETLVTFVTCLACSHSWTERSGFA